MRGWTIPKTPEGRWRAPIETSTGVVLPIWSSYFRDQHVNRHHAHFYAKDYKDSPDHIRAVRCSRLQLVDRVAHARYHKYIDGTQQPADPENAFRVTLLNAAQYIPRFAVDMSAGFPDVIEISRRERRRFRNPKTFSIERSAEDTITIGRFLMDYTTSQEFNPDDNYLIEEFVELMQRGDSLHPRKKTRKEVVGMTLMREAMGAAVDPLEPDYREAKREKFLAQGAPSTALKALINFVHGREPDYFEDFGRKLAAAYA